MRARMAGASEARRRRRARGSATSSQTNARFRRYMLRELERNGPLLSRDLQHDGVPRGPTTAGGAPAAAADAGDPRRARRDRRRRPRRQAAALGSRRARLPAERDGAAARGRARAGARRQRSLGVWRERGVWKTHPDIPDDPVPNRVTFLSPFDRLVHDRDRAEASGASATGSRCTCRRQARVRLLRAADLRGDRIVGRIDVEHVRKEKTLRVNGVWWEDGVRPVSLTPALNRLARFVGAAPTRG